MTLTPNTLLKGRYLIKEVIAKGGMGRVYKAEDQLKGGITVAIKQSLSSGNPKRQEHFWKEARLLANLEHRAIPKVTDYFTEEDGEFLVMEYISGPDLHKEIDRIKPTLAKVIKWADQLLATLEFLHSHASPIIHRDIKPLNLKVVDGQIKLLDFGLAKGTPAYSQMSSKSSLRGSTKAYAPLEQIDGEGTDARSDLFSVGATLYHLLTGFQPEYNARERKKFVDKGHPDPLQPPALRKDFSADGNDLLESPRMADIANFVMKALALEPEGRYASAKAMREALRQIEGVNAILSEPKERASALIDLDSLFKWIGVFCVIVFFGQFFNPGHTSNVGNLTHRPSLSTSPYSDTLKVVSPIIISNENDNTQVTSIVSVTFTVKNVGGNPITIQALLAGARLGENWESSARNDFPAVTNVHLPPGEKYVYNQKGSFGKAGDYIVEPLIRFDNGLEAAISGANPRNFNIKGDNLSP